ncbi:hypothetical protein WJX84_004873 [Apatococcus fuscideae]|uniref:Uncharacterized protein n=1 Tax=Apatococcus fuscideae TaxID=2026836 RepID=A0AAW1S6Y0_9CHLO
MARIVLDPPCIRCQSVVFGSLNAAPSYHTLFTLSLDPDGTVQVHCRPDNVEGDLALLLLARMSGMESQASQICKWPVSCWTTTWLPGGVSQEIPGMA